MHLRKGTGPAKALGLACQHQGLDQRLTGVEHANVIEDLLA